MSKIPLIVIFDIGKTNKKILLFDERYQLVHEESIQLPETKDEDGFACEDVDALTKWVKNSFERILKDDKFDIKAVNISAYGASFVYLDEEGKVVLPLYNYLKPYPQELLEKFYADYGGAGLIGKQTASPSLGSLNSGLQLYRLKYQQPEVFTKIKFALHLPQYISYVLCSEKHADITSIGCHTYLWNFQEHNYHEWVNAEDIRRKFPAIKECEKVAGYTVEKTPVGVGLHDSSAALIPYLTSFKEPFILLSTGTWCISLNPFNHSPLSDDELSSDCLCYLSYEGKPVKASRLFAGYEHELQVKKIATHFNKSVDYYKSVLYDAHLLRKNKTVSQSSLQPVDSTLVPKSLFSSRKLDEFESYEAAYHQLIRDIILQQAHSLNLVLQGTVVKRIFVDGGFSNNAVFMQLIAAAFPSVEIYAAAIPQASALGAALCFHSHWNSKEVPSDIIKLKYYSPEL